MQLPRFKFIAIWRFQLYEQRLNWSPGLVVYYRQALLKRPLVNRMQPFKQAVQICGLD